MFHVISVNTLRQAMAWMGIPSPWFRIVDYMKLPDGSQVSTVKCMWNFQDLVEWDADFADVYRGVPLCGVPHLMASDLWEALHMAFCDDVTVFNVAYHPNPHWFVAFLNCKVWPHDKESAE